MQNKDLLHSSEHKNSSALSTVLEDDQKQNKEENQKSFTHDCTVTDLYNGYVNGCLLMDLRSAKDYEQSHVHSAIHVDLDHPENSPCHNLAKIMYYDYKDSIHSGDRYRKILSFADYCQNTKKCRTFRATATDFDYNAFRTQFPFLCVSSVEEQKLKRERKKYPNYVVDRVYLGDMWNRKSVEQLTELGITHIVDATTDRFPKHSFKILKIQLGDTPSAPIDKYFDEAITFMEDALKDKSNRLFIHCQMGISRSTTLTLVYLMKSLNYTLYDGYALCQRNRPRIRPNDGFFARLAEFEVKVHGKSTKGQIDKENLRDFSHQECLMM